MAPVEMYANATGHPDFVYEDVQSDFYSVPALTGTINSGQLLYNVAAPYSAMSYYGLDRNDNFGGVVPGYAEPLENLGNYPAFCPPDRLVLDSESPLYIDGSEGGQPDGVFEELFRESSFPEQWSYESWIVTEQDNGYSTLSASSFESVQVSDSTLTSGPTITSSPEQEEDSAEDLNNSLEGITSWPAPELYPAIEDHSFMSAASHSQSHESMFKGVAKKEITRKRKRSVDSNKYPCEIRISTKIPKDGKYLKRKAWLGTFATPDQQGRALDVGKYYLCTRKKKTFYDSNSEAILSAFNYHLHEQPLTELVGNVTKLAKHYGGKGSLPQSLNSL